MKGLALESIAFILIALIGVTLLLIFVSNPLKELANNVFCYLYEEILSKSSDACKPKETAPKELRLTPESSEDLARNIAAYSILCWEEAAKSLKTKDTNCYRIILENNFEVSEVNVTDIMIEEGGCNILENSVAKDGGGNEISYPECGENDQLLWDVDGNVIKDQQLILIKYEDENKRIIVKG